MKETAKKTARFLRRSRKGVISSWFFSIFLFCTSLIMLSADNDVRMMRAMLNLKTAAEYLDAECEVIHDISCMLANGEEEEMEGVHATASYRYELRVNGENMQAQILDPYEILELEIRQRRIFDYSAYREEQTDIY